MDCHTSIVICIILFSGIFGGIANFFISYVKEGKAWFLFGQSIILGLSAAIIVPLFLTTIHSNLLDKPLKDGFNSNYFVFAGFCILAAILSRKFIGNMAKLIEVEKIAKEARNRADEAQTDAKEAIDVASVLENTATEQDVDYATPIDDKTEKNKQSSVNDKDLQIVKAISDSKYTYRTSIGISKAVNLPESEVLNRLQDLENNHKIVSKINQKGNKIWRVVQ